MFGKFDYLCRSIFFKSKILLQTRICGRIFVLTLVLSKSTFARINGSFTIKILFAEHLCYVNINNWNINFSSKPTFALMNPLLLLKFCSICLLFSTFFSHSFWSCASRLLMDIFFLSCSDFSVSSSVL